MRINLSEKTCYFSIKKILLLSRKVLLFEKKLLLFLQKVFFLEKNFEQNSPKGVTFYIKKCYFSEKTSYFKLDFFFNIFLKVIPFC